jgi:hypothetical protein
MKHTSDGKQEEDIAYSLYLVEELEQELMRWL